MNVFCSDVKDHHLEVFNKICGAILSTKTCCFMSANSQPKRRDYILIDLLLLD